MIFDKKGHTTIISQEDSSLTEFIENLNSDYSKISEDHIIIGLFSFSSLSSDDVIKFLQISNEHRKNGRSFVLVTDKVGYNDVPEEICVVPTVQEAHDIIQMEEIERELGL